MHQVSPGRLLCSKEAKGCHAHPLVRADGLACHVEAVGERLLFHCDLCNETLPTQMLHRCARACNFDASPASLPTLTSPAPWYPTPPRKKGCPLSPVCRARAGVPYVFRPGGAHVGVRSRHGPDRFREMRVVGWVWRGHWGPGVDAY